MLGSFEAGAFEQAAELRTSFEWQAGEVGEVGGGLLIGITGVGGGLADEFGEGWGVVLGEVKWGMGRLLWTVSPGSGAVSSRDELAVVEQLFDNPPRVAGKGVAQIGFKPLGQGFLVFPVGEFLARLGEEVFSFAGFFDEALGLEVFLPQSPGWQSRRVDRWFAGC